MSTAIQEENELVTEKDFQQKTIMFISANYTADPSIPGRHFPPAESIPSEADIYYERKVDGEVVKGRMTIRYVPGEKSIFTEDQAKDAGKRRGKLWIRDGLLPVDHRETTMLDYLRLSDNNGTKVNRDERKPILFYEDKPEKRGTAYIEEEGEVIDLLYEIKKLPKDELVAYAMVINVPYKGKYTDDIKADLLMRAKQNPALFRDIKNMPLMKKKYRVIKGFDEGKLTTAGNDVCWASGKKIVSVPISEDRDNFLAEFFGSAMGEEAYVELCRIIDYTKPEDKAEATVIDSPDENQVDPVAALVEEARKEGIFEERGPWFSLKVSRKGDPYWNIARGIKNVIAVAKKDEKLQERLKTLLAEKQTE